MRLVDSSPSLIANSLSHGAAPSLEGLQRGSRGPDVVELQRQLNSRGERLDEDGIFGPKTEAAVKRLQGSGGTNQTGRVDAGTATALRAPAAAKPAPAPAPEATTTAPAPRASVETVAGARARAVACESGSRAALEAAIPSRAPAAPPAERPSAGIGAGHTNIPAEHGGPRTLQAPVTRRQTGAENAGDTGRQNTDTGAGGPAADSEVVRSSGGGIARYQRVLEARRAAPAAPAAQSPATGRGPQYADLQARHGGPQVLSETPAPTARAPAERFTNIPAEHGGPRSDVTSQDLLARHGGPTTLREAPAGGPSRGLIQRARERNGVEALSPTQIQAEREGIAAARGQLREEREILSSARSALERDIGTLQSSSQGTAVEGRLLSGRRAQLDAVGRAGDVVHLREQALSAREQAISDGQVTPTERAAHARATEDIATLQGRMREERRAATETVGRAMGELRGSTQPTRSPQTRPAEAGQAGDVSLSRVELDAANARIDQALAGTQTEKERLSGMQSSLQAQVTELRRLPNPTIPDRAVLQGREAQLQTIEEASKHIDIRADGLRAAKRALGDGVLTREESRLLATADTALSQAEQVLAAKWNAAAGLVQRGLDLGGRVTN